jgi:hypothetical protein
VVDGQEEDAVGIENEADGQNKTMDLGPAGKRTGGRLRRSSGRRPAK